MFSQNEDLQQELEGLAQLPETNPYPILRLDLNGTLLYGNPAFRRFAERVGIHEDELARLLPDNYLQLIRRVVNEGQCLIDVKADADKLNLLLTLCPLKSKKEVFLTIIDVTEQQEQVDQLKAYSRQLETAYRQLGRAQIQLVRSQKMASLGMLSAGIAHEINTPLGAISSNQQTLVMVAQKLRGLAKEFLNSADPQTREDFSATLSLQDELVSVSLDGCDRISNIVKSLAAFAGLDEAEVKLVDIHLGIESTLTLLYNQLKRRIRVERQYGDLPAIECYPSRLNQVFLNLLVNAIQAIPEKGVIRIKTWSEGNRVKIRISDTGDGVTPENLERIFDPGFTTRGPGVGAGLGLSICYQIIEEHGGKIGVKSVLGEGSDVTIHIPEKLPLERQEA